MTVPEIMDADPLDSRELGILFHLQKQVVFADWEQSIVRIDMILEGDIFFNFLSQERGNRDSPDTFLSFRFGDDIFSVNSVICLSDGESLVIEVEV